MPALKFTKDDERWAAGLQSRLYMLLKHFDLNQLGLAKKIELGQSNISAWLDDRRSVPTSVALYRLCSRLGISGHWLLTGEGSIDLPNRTMSPSAAYSRGARAAVTEVEQALDVVRARFEL